MENKARLRGHHLICLNFFQGEGYSQEFIQNLKFVLNRARENGVLVVKGADDICLSCPHLKGKKCNYKPLAEVEIQKLDKLALKLLNIKEGEIIEFNKISLHLPEVLKTWKEKACVDCDWKKICQKVW